MDSRPSTGPIRRRSLSALLCFALLAGCVGSPGPTTDSSGTVTGEPVTDYETYVFDVVPSEDSVVDGGISAGRDEGFEPRFYVTGITSDDETARFNDSLVPADASDFIDDVSFESETLVVIQAFPASSVPDYRVESVRRSDGTFRVTIDDSSDGGTDDVTVETVLLRVPGTAPDRVVVTTDDGDTVDSTMGVVTSS